MNIEKYLVEFWNAIDISENMNRAKPTIRGVDKGVFSWVFIAAFIFLAIGTGSLAYFFDIRSTWDATENFRVLVQADLPELAGTLLALVVLALTLMPTLMEIFTAALAKAQIKVMQLSIVGLCIFDAVTDMPRVTLLLSAYNDYFNQLPIVIKEVVYASAYIAFLFLATFGFELMTVLFVYCAVWLIAREVWGK